MHLQWSNIGSISLGIQSLLSMKPMRELSILTCCWACLKMYKKQRLITFKNSHNNDGAPLYKDNGAQAISFLEKCQGSKFPPLKLIVMSASLDIWFLWSLWWCKSCSYAGATSSCGPVDMFYTHHAEPDYLDAALITMFQAFI